ncbi:MAG: hypothetical protein LBQ84_08550, partial [Flavobacteriaceae bacterium]|nr:hypothetical protein [Flavobacteriaceae bacterium]
LKGGTSLAFQAKSGVGTLRRSPTCGYEDSALRAFKKSFRVTHSQSQEKKAVFTSCETASGCIIYSKVLIPLSYSHQF